MGFGLVKIKVGAQAPRPSPLDPTVERIIVTFAAKFSWEFLKLENKQIKTVQHDCYWQN